MCEEGGLGSMALVIDEICEEGGLGNTSVLLQIWVLKTYKNLLRNEYTVLAKIQV